MVVFLSHNKADKQLARRLAMSLAALGEGTWFDEWDINMGQSLTKRIHAGLAMSEMFAVLWSAPASQSQWVQMEVKTYAQRLATDDSLRMVPIMLDDTPLSADLRDWKGVRYIDGDDVFKLALTLLGNPEPEDVDLAQVLQKHLIGLTARNADPRDPLPTLVCPSCGSKRLTRSSVDDVAGDETYYLLECSDCNWSDWTQ